MHVGETRAATVPSQRWMVVPTSAQYCLHAASEQACELWIMLALLQHAHCQASHSHGLPSRPPTTNL